MKEQDCSKIGTFIKNLRLEKKYTQQELADRLSVTRAAVSKWETGKGYPDLHLIIPLSEELGVEPGELIRGERIQPPLNIRETVQSVTELASVHESQQLRKNTVVVLCGVLAVLIIVLIFGVARVRKWKETMITIPYGSETEQNVECMRIGDVLEFHMVAPPHAFYHMVTVPAENGLDCFLTGYTWEWDRRISPQDEIHSFSLTHRKEETKEIHRVYYYTGDLSYLELSTLVHDENACTELYSRSIQIYPKE